MNDLKKLRALDIPLPNNFDQSVWKMIHDRTPRRVSTTARSVPWGDLLWAQPMWLGGVACCVLLMGMAAGQFDARSYNDKVNQRMTEMYVSWLSQEDVAL